MENHKRHVSITAAAKVLGVHISTARRFFDRGFLKGFRNPTSNFRRVYVESLEEVKSSTGADERVEG